MINLTAPYLLAVLAVAWAVTCTVAALVVIIVIVARGALSKAQAKDIPDVLIGLAALVGALPWVGKFGHLVRCLSAMRMSGNRESRALPAGDEAGAARSAGDTIEEDPW